MTFFSFSVLAQMANTENDNIVPNASFEAYSSTPIGWFYNGQHFSKVMKYWNSATAASPDIFGPRVRVPSHWAAKGFGDQTAHQGESMIGITTYGCENGKPHCREYIQIQLSEPLVINQNYYVEYWLSHLENSLQIDNICAYFSEEQFDVKTDTPLELTPQVSPNHILSAPSKHWIRASGTFKAKTEASYLTIGNFYSDSLTNIKESSVNTLHYAYYYVDDVLVKKIEPIIRVPIGEDDLTRIKIEKGKVVQLKNIFFDLDKSELLPRSYLELNKLLQLMQENSTLVIEISGHTDSQGDFDYNFQLSRKRAESVVQFLNDHGIDPKRTLYRGFGSTKPIADNESDSGRQLNRRVEFVIVHK